MGDAASASFRVRDVICGVPLRRACRAIGGNSILSAVLARLVLVCGRVTCNGRKLLQKLRLVSSTRTLCFEST